MTFYYRNHYYHRFAGEVPKRTTEEVGMKSLFQMTEAERRFLVGAMHVPDFEAESSTANTRNLIASSDTLSFVEQPGTAVFFDRIIRDPYGITKPGGDIPGEPGIPPVWYQVTLDNQFGIDPITGLPFDHRLGVFKFSLQIVMQRRPTGTRVAAITASVTDIRSYSLSEQEVIWSAEMIAVPDGNNMLHIDTQYVAFNMLDLTRKWRAKGLEDPDWYDVSTPSITLAFTMKQDSGADILVEYAHCQFQKVAELEDPDKFKPYSADAIGFI